MSISDKVIDKIVYNDPAIAGVVEQMEHYHIVPDEKSVQHMDLCAKQFPESIAESRRNTEIYTANELESALFAPSSRSTVTVLRPENLVNSILYMFENNERLIVGSSMYARAGAICFTDPFRLVPAHSFLSETGFVSQERDLCKSTNLANILIWGKEVCPFNTCYPSFYVGYPIQTNWPLINNYLYVPNVVFIGRYPQLVEPTRFGEKPRYLAVGYMDVIGTSLFPFPPSHVEGLDINGIKEDILKRIDHVLSLAAIKRITHLAIGGIEQMCSASKTVYGDLSNFIRDEFKSAIDKRYLGKFEYIIFSDHTDREPCMEINFTTGGKL